MFTKEIDFFQNQPLTLNLDPQLAKLNDPPPSSGVFLSEQLSLGSGASFDVLGQSISAEFDQQLQVAVVKNASLNQLFDDESGTAPEALPALQQLSFQLGAGLGAEASVPVGTVVSVDINAAAKGAFNYRLVQPASAQTRLAVLESLLSQTRFPLLDSLKNLGGGAVQQFQAQCQLDFGLSLDLGESYSRQVQILGDLFDNTVLKLDAQAALKASIGASLFEKIDCTIGSLAETPVAPPWVRIRIDRAHKHSFTAGLSFALQVQYNLGSVLIQLLEDILELAPVKRFRSALAQLAEDLAPAAAGDWQAIVDKLGAAAADELNERLDLKSFLAQDKFDDIWQTAQSITLAYNNLDAQLKDFWQRLLFKADLAPGSDIRTTLQKIAALKGKTFAEVVRTLIDPDFAEQIAMVEALAGESLEQLLTGLGSRPGALIQQAATRAQQSLTFLETFPDDILSRWREMAQQSGLTKVMTFLQNDLSSPEQLANLADGEIQKLITRLLGKALKYVSQEDLDRVKAFAGKVIGVIGKINNFEQDWKTSLAKLNGNVGFNLGAEIGYVVQRETLLDIQIDSSDAKMQDLWAHLQKLDVPGFLAGLPQDDQDDTPPFLIQECVFTSSRLRTSAFSLLLNKMEQVFDSAKETTKRYQQSRIEVVQQPALQRKASFNGSLYKEIQKNDFKWTGTIALELEGSGEGSDISQPYACEQVGWLITSNLNHPGVDSESLAAARELLLSIGFNAGAEAFNMPTVATTAFELNLRLQLDKTAVKPFLALGAKANTALWEPYYLAAAQAFYGSPLVIADKLHGRPAWQVLPKAVLSPAYRALLPMKRVPLFGTHIKVPLEGGEEVRLDLRATDGTLVSLGVAMEKADTAFGKLAEGTASIEQSMTVPASQKLTRRYPRFANRCSPDGWRHPLFAGLLVWQVAMAQAEFDPSQNTRGLASLRFQQNGSWTEPVWFAAGEAVGTPPAQ